jgi:hypothetical protein
MRNKKIIYISNMKSLEILASYQNKIHVPKIV